MVNIGQMICIPETERLLLCGLDNFARSGTDFYTTQEL